MSLVILIHRRWAWTLDRIGATAALEVASTRTTVIDNTVLRHPCLFRLVSSGSSAAAACAGAAPDGGICATRPNDPIKQIYIFDGGPDATNIPAR